jgi:hypothetical protein
MTYWQIIKYDNIVNHIYQDIKRYAVKVSELSDIVAKIGGSTPADLKTTLKTII